MLSTLGLPSPRKNWLLLSVRTTSLSTVNCTFRQKALCSSGVMESLARSRARWEVSKRPTRSRPPGAPLPALLEDGNWGRWPTLQLPLTLGKVGALGTRLSQINSVSPVPASGGELTETTGSGRPNRAQQSQFPAALPSTPAPLPPRRSVVGCQRLVKYVEKEF